MSNETSTIADHDSPAKIQHEIKETLGDSVKSIDYQALLENYIDESYMIVNPDLIIVGMNESFRKQYSQYYKRDIHIGHSILDYVLESRIEIVKAFYMRALNGEIIEMEIDLPEQNNELCNYVIKYKPIYDLQKRVTGIFVSSFNASFVKKTQLESRKNEIKYQKIIENSLDAFFFCTYNGEVVEVNNAAIELFGYNREEFTSLNRTAFIDHSDGRFISRPEERSPFGKMRGEAIGIRKNGERFNFEFSSVTYYDINNQIRVCSFVSDISERKKAEKAIELSERRYKALIENTSDIILIANEVGIAQYASPAFERITGHTYEELLKNSNLLTLNLHPDNLDAVAKAFYESLEKPSQPIPTSFQFRHKDGHYIWLEGYMNNLLHEENIGAFVWTYRDIDQRKNAEDIVVNSEKRFKALIENASDFIMLSKQSASIYYASPSFERITGYSVQDVYDDDTIMASNMHPQFYEYARQTFFEALANPGVPVYRLLQLKHKNGHYIWLEGYINNLLHDENVKAIVSNYRDISERKEAEAKVRKSENRFRALIEKGEDIIVLVDSSGIISYVSPAFEKLTGFDVKEVLGMRNTEFVHADLTQETEDIFKKLLAAPGSSIQRTNRLKHKDGHYIWVEGFVTNHLHDANIGAIVSNYQDISERLQAAELIKNSENNLKTIFENTSEAFLLTDTNRIIKAFNSNAGKIGLLNNTPDMVIGDDVLNFIEPSRQTSVAAMLERSFKGEATHYDRFYQPEAGEAVWIEFTIKPVYEDGNIIGCCVSGRDITARKIAEDDIRKRELRFRSILENSHDMLFLYDAKGGIEFLSPSIEKSFGSIDVEDKMQYMLSHVHPDDLNHLFEKQKQAYKNPEVPTPATVRIRKQDGSYAWMEGTFTNMLRKREVKVMVANFRDITERKQFEEQQALLVSIVNSSEDSIISVDPDNTILTWNHGAEKMFGYTRKEVIGKNSNMIIPPDRWHEEKEVLDRIQSGVSVKHFETQRMNKNGELVDISLTLSPIKDNNGKITGASKIARDISDKKTSEVIIRNNEKRFRSLIQNSSDGLALFSADGLMLEMSPSGRKILEYGNDETVAVSLRDFVYPDDLPIISGAFFEAIMDPSKIKNFEFRILTRSGNLKWLETNCQNMLYEPTVGAIVVNYRDITDRKNQEIERDKMIKTLNQNNNDLRNFSYITSHNLKAPLSNLMGFIELLADIPIEDSTLRSIILGFKTSTIQLDTTINDLIKILIIRDSNSIEQKEISFDMIFRQVKRQLAAQINEVKPEIVLNFTGASTVVFNATYLESIFINLLTNAIKYRSYERPLKLEVKTRKEENAVILTFADNGVGFDVERHKSKVFGLYQRFHDRPNSKGLGLYLIKSQMESLQGSIEVDSDESVGTTFTLRFQA